MVRGLRDLHEFLVDFVERLNREPESVVVVEGLRDRIALQRLGVRLPILELAHARLELLLEQLSLASVERIIALVDLDSHGDELLAKLKRLAGIYGLIVDERYRNQLRKLRIVEIEELLELLDD